ncbi:MAG: acetylglutamate kinase [Clostridiales bacterium]|nr:acetylglutamate kinase [Clostridiales bacterium]
MDMDTLIKNANILLEALPYIQVLSGKTIVIKYGGNAMLEDQITRTIMQDITLLKYVGMNPIVVHGGGPEINTLLKRLDIPTSFAGGYRVTGAEAMEAVQMVLTGKINKDIVASLNAMDGKAIGLCGIDAGLIRCTKAPPIGGEDLGFVGQIESIDTRLIKLLADDQFIPVIAPVGVDKDGHSYNINADTVAGELAAALQAEKLIFLTDVDGIRKDRDDPSTLIPVITVGETYDAIESGMIEGGMIPKVLGCIHAIKKGVKRTHILNGTIPHPIVLEIFTDRGIGTMVTRDR